MATATVLSTGLFLLSPLVTWSENSLRAVTVECFFLKPCWWSARLMDSVRGFRMIDSRILAAGERREIGLWLFPLLAGFPGLSIGMILAVFHRCGIIPELTDKL